MELHGDQAERDWRQKRIKCWVRKKKVKEYSKTAGVLGRKGTWEEASSWL